MTLDTLRNCSKVAGSKQVKKALAEGRARKVYLASDADQAITAPLRRLCDEGGVEIEEQFDMAALGRAARVEVKTAAIAIVD